MSDAPKQPVPLQLGERVTVGGEVAVVTWLSENTAKVGLLIFTSARKVEDNGEPHTRSIIVDTDAENAPKLESLG
jgi:hypothetical protein